MHRKLYLGIPLNKYIAQVGICSRRKAVEYIRLGRIKVNGRVVNEPGQRIVRKDVVKLDNHLIRYREKEPIYFLLNKQKGVITTVSDPQKRKTVMHIMPSIKERIFPVGRLDINTTGLLLLTNDGQLAHQLTHPRFRVVKTYVVTLHREVMSQDIEHIKRGIRLKDGMVYADACMLLPGAKKNKVRVTLHSGKHRVVRRMFEHMGYIVKGLDRVAFGTLSKRGLARGAFRKLSAQEIVQLKGMTQDN